MVLGYRVPVFILIIIGVAIIILTYVYARDDAREESVVCLSHLVNRGNACECPYPRQVEDYDRVSCECPYYKGPDNIYRPGLLKKAASDYPSDFVFGREGKAVPYGCYQDCPKGFVLDPFENTSEGGTCKEDKDTVYMLHVYNVTGAGGRETYYTPIVDGDSDSWLNRLGGGLKTAWGAVEYGATTVGDGAKKAGLVIADGAEKGVYWGARNFGLMGTETQEKANADIGISSTTAAQVGATSTLADAGSLVLTTPI